MINSQRALRALYLSYDGLTDPLGQSQILPYLRGLATNGFLITIISFEKSEKLKKEGSDIRRICADEGITWTPLPYHKRPPVLSTLFDLLVLLRKARALHKNQSFDIVHCRSYLPSLAGLYFKKRYGIKFIFDMRGFWADERVEGGLWDLKRPLFRFIYSYFKKKEKEFLLMADAIVCLTENSKQFLVSNFKDIEVRKITVIPCCVDLELFNSSSVSEETKRRTCTELNIMPGDFVLLYLGSLGTWYQYEEMVQFFDQLKKYKPNAKFLILTPDVNTVQKRDDFITLTVPRQQVPLYCSMADAAVFFIKPTFSKIASSATKMGELMSLGIPVVTNKGWGDVETFATMCKGLILINDLTLGEVIASIQKSSSSELRSFVQSHFALSHAVSSYTDVYRNCIGDVRIIQ